jgi:hypothetical protein
VNSSHKNDCFPVYEDGKWDCAKEFKIKKLQVRLEEAEKVIEFYNNAHVKDINIRMLKNKAREYQQKYKVGENECMG